MWDKLNPDHQQYWQKTLDHYRKKAAADPGVFGPIVADYEALFMTG
jgi:tRNA (adenine22-N1)-methyltransferase